MNYQDCTWVGRLSKAEEVEACTEKPVLKETGNRDWKTDVYKHLTLPLFYFHLTGKGEEPKATHNLCCSNAFVPLVLHHEAIVHP